MPQNSLLFIPDISGFTNFVTSTEIEHSQHIIAELMEMLIDSNQLNLKLAEIEGDALFFYKVNGIPSQNDLHSQVIAMYQNFHNHLSNYNHNRICHCGACSTADQLTLKFVMHVGEISFIKIKGSSKPYGSEVIKVHRLLKNKVPHNEYALITESVLASSENNSQEIEMTTITGKYDFGEIDYNYYSLSEHKPPFHDSIDNKLPIANIKITKEILVEAHIDQVYENLTNFSIKEKWQPGIKGMSYTANRVNRSGSKHQCVFENFNIEFETFKVDTNDSDTYSFGEITYDIPIFKSAANIYKLSEEGANKTKVQAEFLTDAKGWKKLAIPFFRKRFTKNIIVLLDALKNYSEN